MIVNRIVFAIVSATRSLTILRGSPTFDGAVNDLTVFKILPIVLGYGLVICGKPVRIDLHRRLNLYFFRLKYIVM